MGRIDYLDNLRTAVILLVIVFHAALSYMLYVPSWWYVIDANRVLSADILVIWADVFIMPVLFFLSGFFGLKSLSRDTVGHFLKKKMFRIGVPWLLGSLFIAPVIAYIIIASRYLPLSFSDFYWQYFWGEAYQQAHYWYLGALMALYLLLVAACQLLPRLRCQVSSSAPSALFIVLFILLGAVGYGAVNYHLPDGVWIHPLYLLVLQPTRVPLYLLYFALGAYAWRSQWFSRGGYKVSSAGWLLAFAVCSVVYVSFVLVLPAVVTLAPLTTLVLRALLWSLLCFTALYGLLALFSRVFADSNRFWQRVSPMSYSMYWSHMLIVLLFNWLVRDWPLHSLVKFAVVSVLSLTVIYLLSCGLLNRLPWFAGKKSQPLKCVRDYTF